MSKYTTQVRFICETAAGKTNSVGFSKIDEILQAAAPVIFDFDWPLFDEEYRTTLEIKILRHYYTREICEETVALWKLRLYDKLNMIMPYYNQLYETTLLDFNPFFDTDLQRIHHKRDDGQTDKTKSLAQTTSEDVESSTDTNRDVSFTNEKDSASRKDDSDTKWNLYSDTPQGGIQIFGQEDTTGGTLVTPTIEGNSYLTNATKDTNEASSNVTYGEAGSGQTADDTSSTFSSETSGSKSENVVAQDVITNTQNYAEHLFGKRGNLTYSKMLLEFRETLLNIDAMIIEELSDLFFGLWE